MSHIEFPLELYYYKINPQGKKEFYSKINNSPVDRDDLPINKINLIGMDQLALANELNFYQKHLDGFNANLNYLNQIINDLSLDESKYNNYKQEFLIRQQQSRKRFSEIGSSHEDYYIKIYKNGTRVYYSYITCKQVAKRNLPIDWQSKIKLEPFLILKDKLSLDDSIKDLKQKIQVVTNNIESLGPVKSLTELIQERTDLIQKYNSSGEPPAQFKIDVVQTVNKTTPKQVKINGKLYNVARVTPRYNPYGKPKRPNKITHKDSPAEDKSIRCLICLTNQKTVCTNCGHVCLCASCYNDLLDKDENILPKCPLCRKDITCSTLVYI